MRFVDVVGNMWIWIAFGIVTLVLLRRRMMVCTGIITLAHLGVVVKVCLRQSKLVRGLVAMVTNASALVLMCFILLGLRMATRALFVSIMGLLASALFLDKD